MIREFIIRNRRKVLTITDSLFPNQTSQSDTEIFTDNLRKLMGIGVTSFHEELNNIHMFLRAGRSLYIKLEDNKIIEWRDFEAGKIRKVHQKNEQKATEFTEMENKLEDLRMFEQGILDGYFNSQSKY